MPRRDTPDPSDLTDRDDFERRLAAKLDARRAEEEKANRPPSGWALGIRYGSEFAGGVLIGAGLGLLLDWWLGWTPWGLLGGVVLGFAAGVTNVVRAAQSVNAAGGAGDSPGDDA